MRVYRVKESEKLNGKIWSVAFINVVLLTGQVRLIAIKSTVYSLIFVTT
jgi:hypothetical protein